MGVKQLGVTLGISAALVGGCSSEGSPGPAQETPPPTSSSVPSESTAVSWPDVQACSEPGAYALSTDPAPNIRCAVAGTLKDRIDRKEEVEVYGTSVRIGNIGLNGTCFLHPFVLGVEENGRPYTYLGIAKVSPVSTRADVLTVPFEPTNPLNEELKYLVVVKPAQDGTYLATYKGETAVVGTVVASQTC